MDGKDKSSDKLEGQNTAARQQYTGDLMGYAGTQFRMPLLDTGFRDDRNTQLLPPTALLTPSCNVNYHENGLSTRGGNSIMVAGNGHAGTGIFQFLTPTINKMLFVSNGTAYQTNYSNVLATGGSATNPTSFAQTSKYVFFADGQVTPQYWDGIAGSSSSVTPASSWTGNMPFQMVGGQFTEGNNAVFRALAVVDPHITAGHVHVVDG